MSRGSGSDRRARRGKAKSFNQYNHYNHPHDQYNYSHPACNPFAQGTGIDHFRSQQIRFLTGQIAQAPAFMLQPANRHQASYQQKQRDFRPAGYSSSPQRAKNWNGNFCQQPVGCPQRPAAPAQKGNKDSKTNKEQNQLISRFQNISIGGDSLQDIVCILGELKPGGRITARKIAKELGIQKKLVNHFLYRLLQENRVRKEDSSPPLWSRPPAEAGDARSGFGCKGRSVCT